MSDRPPRARFKSVRLLGDAIHKQMDELRKAVMKCEIPGEKSVDIYDAMGELRLLFDELGAMADRPTIEDVTKQSAGDYVATMKPLVRKYHQQLMAVDKLAPCLCEDLQAAGCILMLIGDDKTVVRTAADPNRPEVQLAVEALLTSMDQGTKEVVAEGVVEAEKQLGIVPDDILPGNGELDVDERTRLLQEAERVGWDTAEGMALRDRAKNYAPGEKLT